MADYIRRLVSGSKARFRDGELNVELDLVYLTDQIIIMGYPAAGIEGLYRNHREDVKKFLDHRHGQNYWIFNFCPIRENTYESDFFYGRLTRYPFPDHHAPPLSVIPLLAREMRAWFNGSPDRVAVLHCKAGKGRSGTMACAYLLSQDDRPTLPKLERSYSTKHWAKMYTDRVMQVVPEEADGDPLSQGAWIIDSEDSLSPNVMVSTSAAKSIRSFPDSLKDVLDLHTSRRMKVSPALGKKVKQGVSIPSQRRFLYYWALLLAQNDTPARFWATSCSSRRLNTSKVRLTQIVVRMREGPIIKKNIVRAASLVMNIDKNVRSEWGVRGHMWASLARYDDELIELLETWERHTRNEKHFGWRRTGSEQMGDANLDQLFEDGKWDKGKMIRSFAGLGVGDVAVVKSEVEKSKKIIVYTLSPLTRKSDKLCDDLRYADPGQTLDAMEANLSASEDSSTTQKAYDKGIVLDAHREVRIKLYMGRVFIGWQWIIPVFHMPKPPAGSEQPKTTKAILTRKEIDFAVGVGSSIVDVEITLEWLREADAGEV